MSKIVLVLSFFLFFIFIVKPIYANHDGCLTVGFWVEDSAYNFFDPSKNPYSHNTFEQWSDNQMISWNKILKDAGAIDCFKISKIVRVRDGELRLGGIKG